MVSASVVLNPGLRYAGRMDSRSAVGEVAIALGVLDNLLEGCQVIDRELRYVYVNDALVRQSKRTREELIGHTMTECYPGIDATPMYATLLRCMTERASATLENEFTFPDGTTGWFELRMEPVPAGVAILSVDITERKRAQLALEQTLVELTTTQQQLVAAQRLEAVGQLAGGIAHDFNNLLSIVLMYSGFALKELPEGSPLADDVDQVRKAGERAAALVRQLLAFSRKQIMEPEVICVNDVVGGIESMIRRLLGDHIEVVIDLSDTLRNTLLDPAQLEQVIMNLVVNARDAMPGGGVLTIETDVVELDAGYVDRSHLFEVMPGPYVRLSVSDTGEGMDADTRNRIFEPFFTTKEVGKGTGLGLAMVYGIVKQSRGNVWVYSEPGRGTAFKIYFPCVDAPRKERTARATEGSRGNELILIVEDDEDVRIGAARILRDAGYRVVTATNGEEALAVWNAQPVALLLSDLMMPKMSGRELAGRLQKELPSMKVLFTSGYSDQTVLLHEALDEGTRFLSKPFTSAELTRNVRAALDDAVVE